MASKPWTVEEGLESHVRCIDLTSPTGVAHVRTIEARLYPIERRGERLEDTRRRGKVIAHACFPFYTLLQAAKAALASGDPAAMAELHRVVNEASDSAPQERSS